MPQQVHKNCVSGVYKSQLIYSRDAWNLPSVGECWFVTRSSLSFWTIPHRWFIKNSMPPNFSSEKQMKIRWREAPVNLGPEKGACCTDCRSSGSNAWHCKGETVGIPRGSHLCPRGSFCKSTSLVIQRISPSLPFWLSGKTSSHFCVHDRSLTQCFLTTPSPFS